MTKKIDQLFRNKLGNRQAAPPPDAWNRLQSQLQAKKKDKFAIYYKIAAAVLLLFCSALAVYHYQENQGIQPGIGSSDVLTQGQGELEAQKALAKLEELAIENEKTEEKTTGPAFSAPTTHVADNNIKAPKSIQDKQQNKPVEPQEAMPLEKAPRKEIAPETLLAEAEKPSPEVNDKKEFPGVTITYIKGGVSESLVAATEPAEKEDKSALKKLLKIAQEIKNTDISLAEIRDSKEDIFALEIEKL